MARLTPARALKVPPVSDITVTPWMHDGLHRGYAVRPDGSALGWIDVGTGELSLYAPATVLQTVASMLRSWAGMPDATLAEAHSSRASVVSF